VDSVQPGGSAHACKQAHTTTGWHVCSCRVSAVAQPTATHIAPSISNVTFTHMTCEVISSQTAGGHAGMSTGHRCAAAVPQKPAAAVRGPGASSVSIWRRCCCFWSATAAICCVGHTRTASTAASHAASSTVRHNWCSSVDRTSASLLSHAAAGGAVGKGCDGLAVGCCQLAPHGLLYCLCCVLHCLLC
jgi:hypothetical protein